MPDESDARDRFAAARVARLATIASDGRPRIVPCCFALAGDTIYTAVDDVKPKRTSQLHRTRDIDANPDVALVVDHYDDRDWTQLWWVRARGTARVVDDAPGLALLCAKYEQYATNPPPGPLIAVTVTEWRWWSGSGQ